jgi:hypothetical protein
VEIEAIFQGQAGVRLRTIICHLKFNCIVQVYIILIFIRVESFNERLALWGAPSAEQRRRNQWGKMLTSNRCRQTLEDAERASHNPSPSFMKTWGNAGVIHFQQSTQCEDAKLLIVYARKATFTLKCHEPLIKEGASDGRALRFENVEGEGWVV